MADPAKPRRRSPRVIRQMALLRENRAVELRSLGMSFAQIAASLLPCHEHRATGGDPLCTRCEPMYVDKSGASKAVHRALAAEYAEGTETKAELIERHMAQIDVLLRKAMREAIGGDWEAMRAATRLLDQRAKLRGLYAPTRHVLTTELDMEIEAMMEQLRDAEREAAQRQAEQADQ